MEPQMGIYKEFAERFRVFLWFQGTHFRDAEHRPTHTHLRASARGCRPILTG